MQHTDSPWQLEHRRLQRRMLLGHTLVGHVLYEVAYPGSSWCKIRVRQCPSQRLWTGAAVAALPLLSTHCLMLRCAQRRGAGTGTDAHRLLLLLG